LTSAKGKTPKFAFLQPTSPFHAYYEDRIKFYENGGDDNEEKEAEAKKDEPQQPPKKVQESNVQKPEKTRVASAIDPIARTLIAQRARIIQARVRQEESGSADVADGEAALSANTPTPAIPPPPTLELINILAPANLSLAQLETIQLVAQFAALDGKGGTFLYQLSTREWNNRDFAFCQPRHPHFAYFSALVDAYRTIISDWTFAAGEKTANKEDNDKVNNLQAALEEAAYRAEYERDRSQQRSNQEEGEVISIDWHTFVVVETIDFPVDEKVELSMLPPPPPTTTTTSAYRPPPGAVEEMDESDDDEGETIRVVPSYTPKVVGTANPQAAMAIDPITGKSVPVSDVPEHLRIQLLDPKWAEERKKFQDKQKESNLVTGDAIVNNLSRYSQAKGDLFGKSVSRGLGGKKRISILLDSLHGRLDFSRTGARTTG
jgi:splicing factor 3A subunit 1